MSHEVHTVPSLKFLACSRIINSLLIRFVRFHTIQNFYKIYKVWSYPRVWTSSGPDMQLHRCTRPYSAKEGNISGNIIKKPDRNLECRLRTGNIESGH